MDVYTYIYIHIIINIYVHVFIRTYMESKTHEVAVYGLVLKV